MSKRATLMIATLAIAGVAQGAVIDFEDIDLSGQPFVILPSPLEFLDVEGSGVDVEIVAGAEHRVYDLLLLAGFPTQALIDFFWPSGSNLAGTRIRFSAPITSFSLEAGDLGGDSDSPLALVAFDEFGIELASDTKSWDRSAILPPFETLSVTAPGIWEVQFNSGGSFANSVFIDDLTFDPETECEGFWPVTTIHTLGKHPVPNEADNAKVSHSITGHIVNPRFYKSTACRIQVCPGTSVFAAVMDSTGQATNIPRSRGIFCDNVGCSVTNIQATVRYTSRSADGKDSDRMTLSIDTASRSVCK